MDGTSAARGSARAIVNGLYRRLGGDNVITLHDYQQEYATRGCEILRQHRLVYYSFQLRTGKTFISLRCAQLYLHDIGRVLFLTKKKAISSIEKDFKSLNPHFSIYVTNYESVHKVDFIPDLVILDEAHCLAQYPVPSNRCVQVKKICAGLPVIYLSGTPSPESFSQLFHQFYVSSFSPFKHKNFYEWAREFVKVKKKYLYHREINDYSNANKDLIDLRTAHLFLSYTQGEAGFKQYVKETVLLVDMKQSTYGLAKVLKRDKVFTGKLGNVILADTEVKLMSKLHQVYSGTVINEEGEGIVFDHSKLFFIKQYFAGKKIAIYYKFQAELKLIQQHYSNITHDPIEFNKSTDKIFVSQIVSGSQGINLSTAYAMVFINVDFSYLQYSQAIARIQSKERTDQCLVYWIFAMGGIEQEIYKRVLNKEDFTLAYYQRNIVMEEGKISIKHATKRINN